MKGFLSLSGMREAQLKPNPFLHFFSWKVASKLSCSLVHESTCCYPLLKFHTNLFHHFHLVVLSSILIISCLTSIRHHFVDFFSVSPHSFRVISFYFPVSPVTIVSSRELGAFVVARQVATAEIFFQDRDKKTSSTRTCHWITRIHVFSQSQRLCG